MLRQQLQKMTRVENVAQHPELLEELSCDHANTIRLLKPDHSIDRYTCLVYVFDFVEKPEYIEIASIGLGGVFAGTVFAHWLLEHNKLEEVHRSRAADGDIVFYFNNAQFKHTGILCGPDRVTSKWGTGHLYEHNLFEVPDSYGKTVRFFRCISSEDAYFFFTEFAEENGVEFEDTYP